MNNELLNRRIGLLLSLLERKIRLLKELASLYAGIREQVTGGQPDRLTMVWSDASRLGTELEAVNGEERAFYRELAAAGVEVQRASDLVPLVRGGMRRQLQRAVAEILSLVAGIRDTGQGIDRLVGLQTELNRRYREFFAQISPESVAYQCQGVIRTPGCRLLGRSFNQRA
jgi:hypothetical protein